MSDDKKISNGKLLDCLDSKLLEPLNTKLIDPLETKFLEPLNTKHSNNNSSQNGKGLLDEGIPEEEKALTQAEQFDLLDDNDTECGLGPCAPKSLQSWATKEIFLIVFCISWVLQGMFHTYFVSAITTIEKLFQIQSKVTGMIMSATEIGQIGSSLLLTYYGGQGHRPKWIAGGMVLFAVSTFTCSLPHFIYGKQLILANELSGLTTDPNTCTASPMAIEFLTHTNSWNNLTELDDILSSDPSQTVLQVCRDVTGLVPGQRMQPAVTKIVLSIFFISLLGVGMGQTAVYTLGIPYIDDNVASKESPLYFGITIGVRILGPALGFIVGSFCSSIYADLSVDPKIDTKDARWVGAWWIGLVGISGLLMLTSLAMFAFPKRLIDSRQVRRIPQRSSNKEHPSIRDFPKTVKRLLNNDILMYRTASSVLHILPVAGLYTFLPKFLESQFRLPTPSANMISGVGGILVMGFGIVISGIFILRVKPNAKFVAGWIACTAFIYAAGMAILMFIGCPLDDLAGLVMKDNVQTFDMSCSQAACDCNLEKFSPICGEDGRTYLSPCQAGCRNFTKKDGRIQSYSDCACIPAANPFNASITSNPIYGNATVGYCDTKCTNFKWYIIVFSVFVFVHSTSEVGSILLILRCVESRDKAMALGLIQFAIGLFGNVPCPIIYGAVVDSACLVWTMACGDKGACGLYDSKIFRMFFHGCTSGLLLLAFFVDVVVWYKAGNIIIAEEKEKEEELTAINAKIPDVKSEPPTE